MKKITKARLWGIFYCVVITLVAVVNDSNVLQDIIIIGLSMFLGAQSYEINILQNKKDSGDVDEIKRLLSEVDKRNERTVRNKSVKGKNKRS